MQLPTTDELVHKLLDAVKDTDGGSRLNDYALSLASDVKGFLRVEYGRPFPEIGYHLLNARTYLERLQKEGAVVQQIEGSSGFYIGSRIHADIYVNMNDVWQYVIEGNPKGAALRLVHILIEEHTHVLFPDVSDHDIWPEVARLVEKFVVDFRFTDEQKKMIEDSVSGPPKDGLLRESGGPHA